MLKNNNLTNNINKLIINNNNNNNQLIKSFNFINKQQFYYYSKKNHSYQPPKYKTIDRLKEQDKKKKEEILGKQLKELDEKVKLQKQREQNDFNIYNILKDDNKKPVATTTTTITSQPSVTSTIELNDKNISDDEIKSNLIDKTNSFKIKTQLMRDFIQESLYHQDYGYFQSKEVIVPSDIEMPSLDSFANYKEYTNYLHYLYKSLEHAWVTPVELFKPYYSWSISNYIIDKFKMLKQEQPDLKLKVYEIGAGSGTNALNILNHIRENHNEIYSTMEYRIIEISKPLAEKQLNRIKSSHPTLDIKINNASILEWNQQEEKDECFIILTEVIDNLPHDKITITSNGIFESTVDSTVFETVKDQNSVIPKKQISGFHREESRLLSDPIIKEYLEYENQLPTSMFKKLSNSYNIHIKSFFKGDESKYIPTVCFKLFQIFSTYFPKHHIVLADFDELPSLVSGENAPTVQEKVPILHGEIDNPYHIEGSNRRGYESIDRDEILVQPGTCDIFFPYDWDNLYSMYCFANKDRPHFNKSMVQTLKHKDFMKQYGSQYLDKTKTKSGYNPILSDYKNMSFLLS